MILVTAKTNGWVVTDEADQRKLKYKFQGKRPIRSQPIVPQNPEMSQGFDVPYTSERKLFSCSVMSKLLWFPWTTASQASLSFTISQSLLKFAHVHWVGDAIQPTQPLSIFPSIFSNESPLCIRWSKYWSFSFSISPPNEYSGLISSQIDSFDLLAVQGTLKSLLQHHSSKASRRSAFFMVQLCFWLGSNRKISWNFI